MYWPSRVYLAQSTILCLQPELHGVLPVVHNSFTLLHRDAVEWPDMLKQAVAVCNSLTLMTRTQVVGDLAEKAAFKTVEARFVVSTACSLSHTFPLNSPIARRMASTAEQPPFWTKH